MVEPRRRLVRRPGPSRIKMYRFCHLLLAMCGFRALDKFDLLFLAATITFDAFSPERWKSGDRIFWSILNWPSPLGSKQLLQCSEPYTDGKFNLISGIRVVAGFGTRQAQVSLKCVGTTQISLSHALAEFLTAV